MEKEFEEWYQQNERRFHCGHFDEKQIAYAAWIEGRNQALSMSGVGDMFICANQDLEKGRCLDQCIACFKVEFECK